MSVCAQDRVRARAMCVRTDMICTYMTVASFLLNTRELRIAVAATTPPPGPFLIVASCELALFCARLSGATTPRLPEIPYARTGEKHKLHQRRLHGMRLQRTRLAVC